MNEIGRLILALTIGVGGGIGSAWYALSEGLRFGRVDFGPWSTWPRGAGLDADPYSRAALARDGRLPLAVGEGITLEAVADNNGARLDGRCRYRLAGTVPTARAWTLTAHLPGGKPVARASGPVALTSSTLLRRSDGSFAITLSPTVEPGNWIATPQAPYVLVLNLYDTAISGLGGELSARSLPRIERQDCP